MGVLSDELREMGYEPTGEESPVDASGEIWSNGYEKVCDETGIVIDGNHHGEDDDDDSVERRCGKIVYRYHQSKRVKLNGGYTGSYDWGHEDDRFRY